MRTFIAIELPKEIKETLGLLQEELKKSGADVKWVSPSNIHLTLKFLGEIDAKKLNKLNEILENVALKQSPFSLGIKGIGVFPNLNSPRVIWVGVEKGDEETKRIAAILEEEIAKIGIPKERRPYSTHITLGRLRSGVNRMKLLEQLNYLKDKSEKINLEFTVKKITLLKSTLTPQGPIYEILKEANLKTT
ncbi:MAG: RNA 2',3'-cyclic phosphodiesterase [Candidatus Omnitrophica bacterium]|nr:RNA 2',3'-cyclic phosphodiesterase [Candidatus Omnitrophota bacterium]